MSKIGRSVNTRAPFFERISGKMQKSTSSPRIPKGIPGEILQIFWYK